MVNLVYLINMLFETILVKLINLSKMQILAC